MKSLRIALVCMLVMSLVVGTASAASFTAKVTASLTSASSISVSPQVIGFGAISGGATTYRFKTPVASVSAYPAAGAWEIRVYTDNGTGPAAAPDDPIVIGFIRDAATVGANRLYLKVWCPNSSANGHIDAANGPTLASNSIRTDYLWKGKDLDGDSILDETLTSGTYSEATLGQDLNGDGDITDTWTAGPGAQGIYEGASFSYIREAETFVGTHEEDTVAGAHDWRCVLSYKTAGRGDGDLGSPFPVVFACDTMSNPTGSYNSDNNTVAVGTGTAAAGVFFELKIF